MAETQIPDLRWRKAKECQCNFVFLTLWDRCRLLCVADNWSFPHTTLCVTGCSTVFNDVDIRSSCTCCDSRWMLIQHAVVVESDSMTCETIAFKNISVFCRLSSYCSLYTKVRVTLPTVGDGTLEDPRFVPVRHHKRSSIAGPEANGRVKLLSSITNPNPNVYPTILIPLKCFTYRYVIFAIALIWRPIAPRLADLFCYLLAVSLYSAVEACDWLASLVGGGGWVLTNKIFLPWRVITSNSIALYQIFELV